MQLLPQTGQLSTIDLKALHKTSWASLSPFVCMIIDAQINRAAQTQWTTWCQETQSPDEISQPWLAATTSGCPQHTSLCSQTTGHRQTNSMWNLETLQVKVCTHAPERKNLLVSTENHVGAYKHSHTTRIYLKAPITCLHEAAEALWELHPRGSMEGRLQK